MRGNLPPGCRESDIPGCGSEDAAFEAFCEKLDRDFPYFALKLPASTYDDFAQYLWEEHKAQYAAGYRDGVAEMKLYHYQE